MASGRSSISGAMFFAGAFGVLAQVTFARETLVAFFGSELTIGAVLAAWLAGISLGGFCSRLLRRRLRDPVSARAFLAWLFVVMGAALPCEVLAIRTVRLALGVPPGETAAFEAVLASSAAIFLPVCAGIGLFFPVACGALAGAAEAGAGGAAESEAAASAVSRAYAFESLGGMLGGAALTYLMLPFLGQARIVCLGCALAATGAAWVAPRRLPRFAAAAAALALAAAAIAEPPWLRAAGAAADRARWRAFGVLERGGGGARLVGSRDTVYQNLAVTESQGQFVLYGNGQVMFAFPDPPGAEYGVHFVMAQNPRAGRVLLLGGNPAGDIPELLKYPLKRLVYVELDPGVGRMVREATGPAGSRALDDPRLERVAEDAPRFVSRCRERFDAVLINGPAPTTAAANRFYTLEFYEAVRRILAPGGFAYTAVASAERLQTDAAGLGASVYGTLCRVFPVVLATAEATNRFFAGGPEAGLTFDGEALFARSAAARVQALYYRPEYLLAADEIADEKTRYVKERFLASGAPVNTGERPAACFYSLLLWSRYSGSGMGALLRRMRAADVRVVAGACLAAGLALLAGGAAARAVRGRRGGERAGGRARWAMAMLGALMASTGFCGMAMEIALLFLFQSLYGYVYARMGLIVASFMLGLVLGAVSGRRLAGGGVGRTWHAAAGVEAAFACLALLVAAAARAGAGAAPPESAVYLAVALAGWIVGAEFPLANRLFCLCGGTVREAAALTAASDQAGAAAGALAVGVFLAPVLGVGGSCIVLAAVKGAGLLCVYSARLAAPPAGEA